MNPLPDFLQPLEFETGTFPYEAMTEAIARREESTPHLLSAIAWAHEHPDAANDTESLYLLHIYAMFLLAQFREPRALPLVVRMFRSPRYEELTADLVTDSLPQILASVSGGDTGPIKALIEDLDVDEWVRGAAVCSLGVLLHTGSKTREEVSGYFSELFDGRLEREPGDAWDSLVSVCVDFGMTEHLEEIRRLYREGIAGPYAIPLEFVESQIALSPDSPQRGAGSTYDLIDDAIEEMEFWECFDGGGSDEGESDDFGALERALLDDPEHDYIAPTPIVRTTPKIGRNDLCPCGSGKKYKKCCGEAGVA